MKVAGLTMSPNSNGERLQSSSDARCKHDAQEIGANGHLKRVSRSIFLKEMSTAVLSLHLLHQISNTFSLSNLI
jgi:hypothetical protein